MAKTTQTLSVRIDPKVLKELIKYTKENRGVTQAKVVENLIAYFAQQSPEQQHLLVRGVGSDYLGLLGKALQLVTWGDHAYTRQYLPWAIETYDELDRISAEAEKSVSRPESAKERVGILSLRRIAWFKLGSAWMDVAMQLRARALVELANRIGPEGPQSDAKEPNRPRPETWDTLYDAALDSLRVAIGYHRLFNKSLEVPQPAVLYNQACAWTLMAQYRTEQKANDKELYSIAQHEQEEEEARRLANNPMLELCLPPSDDGETADALQRATECLQKIKIHYQGNNEGMPLGDTQWLFDYAERDPDLSCFRKGKTDAFDRWVAERKSRTSLLDSFKRLRYKLPAAVEEAITSASSDLETKATS